MKRVRISKSVCWIVCLMMMGVTVVAGTQQKEKGEPAQSSMKEPMQRDGEMTAMKQECRIEGRAGTLQSADALIGMAVQDVQRNRLGYIQELIVDDNRQTIQYVIVSANDKLYPVPWTAFDSALETYTLNVSADHLRQAPSIPSADVSQFSRSDFQQQLGDYYSDQISAIQNKGIGRRAIDWTKEKTEKVLGEPEKLNLYAFSKVIGRDIQNMQGKQLGELDDAIFDVRQGNLAYGLVGFGGLWGFGEKTAAVPWKAIQLQPDQKIVNLDTDEMTLQTSVLPKDDLQMLSEPAFARQIHRDFSQEPYWEVFGFVAPTHTEAVSGMALSGVAWQPDSPYNKNFDASTVQTIEGTIQKVGSFTPEKDAVPGLKLNVETKDGQSMTVHAGPADYYRLQTVKFQKGDQITITGSKTMVNQKSVIMATHIQKGSDAFHLRDAQGKPLWNMETIQEQMRQQEKQVQEKPLPRQENKSTPY